MKIYSSAPCRISLLGGGTDIPTYANLYGGACLNMAINIRQHFIFTDKNGTDNIYPRGADPKFYKQFYKHFGWTPDTTISTFDGIIESGLGSSAAAAVALVGGLSRYNNTKLSPSEVAETAWNIEVNKIGLFGGRQDQYASAFGGVNLMEFGNGVKVTRLTGFIDKILPSLCLFYIGSNRKSANIQEGFKKLTEEQVDTLDKIKNTIPEGIKAISKGDIKGFGEILDEAWRLKKKSNKGVTNQQIDDIYEQAKNLGAYGCKILGAGGGGHLLVVIDPKKRENLIKMIGLKYIDFSICYNGLETRVEE